MSGLLCDRLHWLRVPEHVEYKVCLLVFKALHGMAPNYLSELCRPNVEDTAHSRLRSAARGDLPSSTQQDELWKPCICCRWADVLEQTSSKNAGKRLTAKFQVSA